MDHLNLEEKKHFFISVSMGQTTTMASAIPAPKPHKRLRVLSNRPVASRMGLLSISNVPNLRERGEGDTFENNKGQSKKQ
uniref:Uncharacterized protein n=1 Tax=Lates calcarifer TaxID=8187 RepID=A0A4W6DAA7_LATCA